MTKGAATVTDTGQAADRTELALNEAWKEMEDFLARFKASSSAKTAEEFQKLNAEFVAILERCIARLEETLEREKAPELATGDRKTIEP